MAGPPGSQPLPFQAYPLLLARLALLGLTVWLGVIGSLAALAGEPTPEGRWQTIDDRTGKPRSVVRLWIAEGRLNGKVEELIRRPDEDPDPVCDECSGERKDQPIKGMLILWGLTRDQDEPNEWSGGSVLDPDNGTTYRCLVRVSQDGDSLEVRGYIGFSFIGRSQTWHRVK